MSNLFSFLLLSPRARHNLIDYDMKRNLLSDSARHNHHRPCPKKCSSNKELNGYRGHSYQRNAQCAYKVAVKFSTELQAIFFLCVSSAKEETSGMRQDLGLKCHRNHFRARTTSGVNFASEISLNLKE